MENKEKMVEKVFEEFLGKDISIIIEGTITTDFVIKEAKIAISDKRLMLVDTASKQELILSLDELSDIKIRNSITFEYEMQTVTIDC